MSDIDISPKHFRKSIVVGAVLHSDRTPASATPLNKYSRMAIFLGAAAIAACAAIGCGNNYRPVVSAINPVGPAAQPTKYAIAVSSAGPTALGLVTMIDFSGDTIVNTTLIGMNPQYFNLASSGFEGYTINSDGTLNSFDISTGLLASQVLQSTLLPGSNPVSIFSSGTTLYVSATGLNAVTQLTGLPPAIQQQLPTGANTVYTVGIANAPRIYALVQGSVAGAAGKAVPIETTNNTTDTALPVGVTPIYGVMTADSRRAFVLNNGSNNVTVINAQSNALDSFNLNGGVSSTIPVGVAPVWADFAPTLNELLVANAGNGTTAGSVTIISIPLCSQTTVTTNPNCDTSNPIDAVGFGQVVANIPVGVNPVMIAVMQDGSQAFVANAGNAAKGIAGSVSVIDLATNTVVATVPAANSVNEADAVIHGHPNWIAVTTGTPTGKAYVTAPDSTDISIIRSDIDTIQTHLSLQGYGVAVRVNQP